MNLQETQTNELVEIVRQQAERFLKPDEAIWKKLMARRSWVGCPKEDLALIGSLDSLLRPLNRGCTMLPPRIRQIPSAGISPPPPYYQKKVSLSQVINISSGQTEKISSLKNAEAIATEERVSDVIKQKGFQPPEQIPETFNDVIRKPILKSRFRLPIAIAVVLICGLYAIYAILPDAVKLEIWNSLANYFHSSRGN
jgi:hypothetical protein